MKAAVALLLLAAALLSAPAQAQRNVFQEIGNQNLTVLANLTATAGLQNALSTTPGITVFAPENAAFTPQIVAALNTLPLLSSALQYHVVAGVFLPRDLQNNGLLTTLTGAKLRTNIYSFTAVGVTFNVQTVNGKRISQPINCTNGILYTITEVLLPPANNTLNAVRTSGVVETLPVAIGAAGLSAAFNGNESNPFTLLAPRDTAFAALPPTLLQVLLAPANADILRTILLHHVIPGTYFPSAFLGGINNYNSLTTLAGTQLSIGLSLGDGSLTFGNGITAPLSPVYQGTDGLAYILNGTLIPPYNLDYAVRLSNLTTLYAALKSQGFDGALRTPLALGVATLTVFGPTNQAFTLITPAQNASIQNDLAGVLFYHVVNNSVPLASWTNDQLLPTRAASAVIRLNKYVKPSGTVYTANGAVVSSSQVTTTGVLHVVERVLSPITLRFNDTVLTDPRLTTFRTAAIAANVFPQLALFNRPVTIFAPTNDAFAALPAGALAGLLNNTQQLFGVLANHVLFGTVYSAGLFDGQVVTTAATNNITVTVGNTVTVGGATVVQADISHVEGVIHIIDKVILPPAPAQTSAAQSSSAPVVTGVATTAAATTGAPVATTGGANVPTSAPAVTTANSSDASRVIAGLFALCLILFAL